MNSQFLTSATNQFDYYKLLGEKTIAQLPEEKLFWQYNAESNSVATIVKHLSGNMLSRWADFLTTDGEKEWRKRDDEFENDIKTRIQLLEIWDKGWNCLFNALKSITENDYDKLIYIRNQRHSISDAIIRQIGHYCYHVGQIVFVGKMICDKNWTSLSIPKGNSNEYNDKRFSQEKSKTHFTDEHINTKKD